MKADEILRALTALDARLLIEHGRFILRAGRHPIPEPLVEQVRAARAQLEARLKDSSRTHREVGSLWASTPQNSKVYAGEIKTATLAAFVAAFEESPAKDRQNDRHYGGLWKPQGFCGADGGLAPKTATLPTCSEPKVVSSPNRKLYATQSSAVLSTREETLLVCCECGRSINELLPTLWGGDLCHCACGEAAFQREKTNRRAVGGTA